jgi:YegS/Rv2252/BmrU family lipid kinase
MDAFVREAMADGIPMIALGGGDGTFTHVADLFADQDAVLGVLPLGTGNAFARDLGIQASVQEAVDTLVNGKVQTVDLGLANGHSFLNVATVGLTTQIALGLDSNQKKRLGRLAYLFALAKGLAKTRPFHAALQTETYRHEFDSMQVVVGNGRFHAGPFPLSPEASITEGRLSVYAPMGKSRAQFVRLAWHLRTGKHVDLDDVFAISCEGGELITIPNKRVTVDGEIKFRTPLTFSVRADCLKVMVPQSFQG